MTQPPGQPSAKRGPWTLRGAQERYDNPWMTVTEHQVTNAAGSPGIYGVVHFKNLALGVLPLHEDGTVTLVGQHRFPFDRYSWEMPEGGGPRDVDPMLSALRELREETGLQAARLEEILRMDLSNSITDEEAIVYLATGLTPGPADPDEDEVLQVRRVHFSQVLRDVLDGRIRDSLTVAAVLRAHHMAVTGGLAPGLAEAMLVSA